MGTPRITPRRAILCITAILVLAAVVLIFAVPLDPLYSKARRQWKNQAIATIEQRLADKQWFAEESARLKTTAASRPYMGGWAGDGLIVLKNGEWIVNDSVCVKQKLGIKDLFLGRGSDGKWYYSTFHFCSHQCVLEMERQPDSLAQFVDAYWLVPFDGRSDECLKKTWDGGAHGDEKIMLSSRPSGSNPAP